MAAPTPTTHPTLDELLEVYAQAQEKADGAASETLLERLIAVGPDLLLALGVVATLALLLYIAHLRTKAYYASRSNLEFRRQVIMLGLTVLAVLLAIVLIPMQEALRGQLLSLFGLIVSATIALSSTTLVGNAMAGIMLRTIRNFDPGDYVHVGDHFGRISEIDLLHTEIQTEDRDLTTLPNMYMVTHPVRVLRNSGTILSVEVSLGYDVPRPIIEKLLLQAATETGLESPFVQIRALGDYSISYAIAGLLTEVKNLLQKRRELRARTIDTLHAAGVEIASPALLSMRQFPPQHPFAPPQGGADEDAGKDGDSASPAASPDSLIFDKAYEAESLDQQRKRLEELNEALQAAEKATKSATEDADKAASQATTEQLQRRIDKLKARIAEQESKVVK